MKYYPTDKETDSAEKYHERYGNLNAPDDVPWTYHIGRAILIIMVFTVSLIILALVPLIAMNLHTVKEQKTGVILLLLFTLFLGVCLRLAAKK